MTTYLVTGGAGFIGSNFIHYMLSHGACNLIINYDNLTYAGNMDNLANLPNYERHIFIKGDICDKKHLAKIITEFHVDTIVHFAAETHVDRSIDDPEQFIKTNVMGTYELLQQARERNLRFHHVSTDEVYGSLSPGDAPWTEDSPYAPNSPYAASKAASDHLVRSYGHTYGLKYTITNCSNNYGPRQHPEKLIPMVITNALAGKPIPIYGDGQQIRDWLYVDDHCEAIRLVLEKGVIGETYNIGGGNQPTNTEIIQTLCDILGNGSIEYVKDRKGHDRRYALDSSKIRKTLDWYPVFTLNFNLRKTVEWYIGNKNENNTLQK